MNRATKRLMAKQQAAEARRERPRPQPGAVPGATEKRKRTPPRQFLREVRSELKKVAWPSRTEVFTYTVVVIVSLIVMTLIVFALDFGFAKGVLRVFDKTGPAPAAPLVPGGQQQVPPPVPPVQSS